MPLNQNAGLTGPEATPILSVKPWPCPHPNEVRICRCMHVCAPISGTNLPIVLFAHGFGSNLDGYAPLVDYWASHGFVVIQATHLNSRRYGVASDGAHKHGVWRQRVQDMTRILDELDGIEARVPGLPGRADHSRIVAAGHSFGGQTAGILVGLRVVDPETGERAGSVRT